MVRNLKKKYAKMEEKGENVGFYARSIFILVVMVVVRDFNHLISCVNGFFFM